MKSKNTVTLLTRILLILVLLVGFIWFVSQGWFDKTLSDSEHPVALQNLGQLPLMFVENQGQWNDEVVYRARKQGMTAWLQRDGITFQFEKRNTQDQAQGVTMQMTFEGASELVSVEGAGQQSRKHHYFIGENRSHWYSAVSSYVQVMYKNLYDDVDLCVREEAGWIEYDLLLAEDADLSQVIIRCDGINALRIDSDGSLVMETEFGPIRQKPPTAWYEFASGEQRPVQCRFRRLDRYRYGFEVPESDLGLALVIDPGLEWSTFLGAGPNDHVLSCALTSAGDVVVVGHTESVSFPTTPGAYDTTFNGFPNDGFVSCLGSDGDTLLWSTFLGGSGDDILLRLVLDDSNRATVVGMTKSSNFPTTPNAFDTIYSGDWDAVIARLSADGSQLVYSTLLGGSGEEWAVTIDVDSLGEVVVGGYTGSSDFPTTPGAYDSTYNGGIRDAFVIRLNADATGLVYSTYLGGSNNEGWQCEPPYHYMNVCDMGLMLDGSGDVILSGETWSSDFPTTPGAYDMSFNGVTDVFVTRLNADGSSLVYSTFLGGSSYDGTYGFAIDEFGAPTISGITQSNNFPFTPGADDTALSGNSDAFMVQMNVTGDSLLYSTFLGSPSITTTFFECANALILDDAGKVILTGQVGPGFPTTPGAFDTTFGGVLPYEDAFLSRISPDGNGEADLRYSTYLGGWSYDLGWGLALVADSTVIVAGITRSNDFPTTPGAYDTTYGGQAEGDGFICRFGAHVGIQEETASKPQTSIILSPIFPNPSQDKFSFTISLQKATKVQVHVLDITGRLIATLINEHLSAGIRSFTWNSKSSEKELASGVYFVKFQAGDYNATEKLLLIR
jgi:hypothetical protein